jgi:hypothetical protein
MGGHGFWVFGVVVFLWLMFLFDLLGLFVCCLGFDFAGNVFGWRKWGLERTNVQI